MGVVVIREEHPFAEFLKGIQPIGEAYFNRQAERGRANLLNDIDNYAGAKPTVMQASQLGDQWTQGYNPSQATGAVPQGLMDMQNNEALYSQFMQGSGATYPMQEAQQQFAANQAAEKARLIKQGADYFGPEKSQQLINNAESKQRIQNLLSDPNTTHQDLLRAALSSYGPSEDPKNFLSGVGMLAPNPSFSTVNTGGVTKVIRTDSTGNSPEYGVVGELENTRTPAQVDQNQQYKDSQIYDWKKYTTGLTHQTTENQKNRDSKNSETSGQYLNAKVTAAGRVLNHKKEWVASGPGEGAVYPFEAEYNDAVKFLASTYNGSGATGVSPGPRSKEVWETAVQRLISKGATREQAEEHLRKNGYSTQ